MLIRPLITEKSTGLKEDAHQYSFKVHNAATKGDIRRAVEGLFKVRVLRVRTVNMRGKLRRMGRTQGYLSDWKKAMVTIAADQKIDFEKV
ncbi:MAG: 50S ribosomal protein L23 [Elusimicrobia bacterium]|nr:50S ribosomal protein L23 [Elusimicrobiota bacterium]